MLIHTVFIVGTLFLFGCTSSKLPVSEWVNFVEEINELSPSELMLTHEDAQKRFDHQPTDDKRLRLSYLLSRGNASTQNLERSHELLAEIPSNSDYAPLRDLVSREITVTTELHATQNKLNELKTQLETLKTIDGDLLESQKDMDEISP